MGQKVSPVGLRIGINKDWESKWYANKKDFSKFSKVCTSSLNNFDNLYSSYTYSLLLLFSILHDIIIAQKQRKSL